MDQNDLFYDMFLMSQSVIQYYPLSSAQPAINHVQGRQEPGVVGMHQSAFFTSNSDTDI